MTNKEFIDMIAPIIVSVAKKRGYKYPSAIIAQACVESGYGRSSLGKKYHNYFGLKCGSKWKGKSVNLTTKEEYKVGELTTIKDNFRVFESVDDGVNGYFDFISTNRYANLRDATSSENYLEIIKSDGYATSSKYVATVYAVVKTQCLLKYDSSRLETISAQTSNKRKTDIELAKEVIKGKWGNGLERKQRLTANGYNYKAIQKLVNKIL